MSQVTHVYLCKAFFALRNSSIKCIGSIKIRSKLIALLMSVAVLSSCLGLVEQTRGACYSGRKFPIVLSTSTNQNSNYLSAVTADSNAILAGGYVQSTSFFSSSKAATITRTNLSTMSWAWRRVYEEPSSTLNVITALALNPAGTKLAAYGWNDMSGSGSNVAFVFAVDALSGWKTSEALRIDHQKVMDVQSSRLRMDSQDTVYMAFYQKSGSQYNGYEDRLRVASFNAASSTLGWIKMQNDYYGRAGALTLGNSPQGTSFIYLGGSGRDSGNNWFASITQLNFDGTLYVQHYIKMEKDGGGGNGKRYDDEEKTMAIDHMHYWVESASGQHWLFGTTRSHEHSKKGKWMGIWKAEVQTNTNPIANSEYCLLEHTDVVDESHVMGVYPQMINDGSNYFVHFIYQRDNWASFYMKARFNSSQSDKARRIMADNYGKEAFFVNNSPLATISQTLQGYQAYVVGQAEYWGKVGGSWVDLNTWAGVLHTTHAPSSTSCRRADNDDDTVVTDHYIYNNLYEAPDAQKSFSDLTLSNSIVTLTVSVPILTNPIDMSDCYGDPTNIGGLVAGAYSHGTICYSNAASISKTFTSPQVTVPAGCNDTPWEYYPVLDASSPNSPLPTDMLIQFDVPSQDSFTLASPQGTYPGPALSIGTYVVNVMAVEPSAGQTVQAFQFTFATMCCNYPTTTWNKPTIVASHSYSIGEAAVTETTPIFSTSSPSCCAPLTYTTTISPTPPIGVFTIDATNQRQVSWVSSDLTAAGPLTNSPFMVRVTASIGCGMPDEYVEYSVTFVDSCPTATITLDPTNELLASSQPVLTYTISDPQASISWDSTDASTDANAICGSLVYELWDVTLGSENTLATPFSSTLTGATHEAKVQSTSNAFIGTQTLRYKVYIDNYAANVKLDTDFQVKIEPDCTAYTITVDSGHPLSVASLVYSQEVEATAQVISWPDTQITTNADPACLPLIFELWDVTTGSEVTTNTKNIVVADFSTSTHTLTIFTNDFSQVGTHDVRFKIYLSQDATNLVNQDFQIQILDPCLVSATITLDLSNVLQGTSPVLVYDVGQPAGSIFWPDTEVLASFSVSCGSLVYELWDVTSGAEVAPSVTIFAPQFSTATHSIAVATSDFSKVGVYNLRYKVYIDNYPSGVVLNHNFDIQIQQCTPTSVTVSNDVPIALSYIIGRSAEVSATFSEFTVVPSTCNLSYQMISISPSPANAALITFDGTTRQITVQGNNLFEGGDHDTGSYVPQVYTATIKAFGDNNFDTGTTFSTPITVVDPCDLPAGLITFSSSQVSANPLSYKIGDPAVQENLSILAPKLVQAETTVTCPPIALSMTDDSLNALSTYNAFSFDPTMNQFKIESSDLADSVGSPFTMRVHAQYTSAVHSYQIAGTFDFDVQVINSCLSPVSMVSQAQTNPPNYPFKNAYPTAPSNVVFSATQNIVDPSFCSITYSCISNTGPRTDMCSINLGSTTISTFDPTTGDYTLETSDFDPFPADPLNPIGVPPGSYQFTIQGTTGDKSATFTFDLVIEDPCLTNASLLIQQHIFDSTKSHADMIDVTQQHLLNDPAINFAWNDSTFVSQQGGVIYSCGPQTTKIFKNDGLETPFDATVFEDNRSGSPSNVFSVKFTIDHSKLGSYEISYKVYLSNYPTLVATSTAKYSLTIANPCSAALLMINQGSLVDQEYFLTDTALVYQIDPWTPNNSFCALAYAYSSNQPTIMGLITTFDSDPTQRQFIFDYSTDLTPSGLTFIDYTITIDVTCQAVSLQNTFNLKIKNPCIEPTLNQIIIPGDQPLYTYKIGSLEKVEPLSVFGGNLSPQIALCGALTLQTKLVSHTTSTDPTFVPTVEILDATKTPIAFDSTTEELTIFTDQNVWIGDHDIELSAFLNTYPTVKIDPSTPILLKLKFEPCIISEVVTPQMQDVEINFGDQPRVVTILDFIDVGGEDCNYVWYDYALVQATASTSDNSKQISDYVAFDPTTRELTLHAQVANTEELVFDFTIDAKLSDEVTLGKTNNFKITVPPIPIAINNNTAPFFEKEVPTSFQVFRDASGNGNLETIDLGSVQDLQSDTAKVVFNCGKGCPILFDLGTNQIQIPADAKPGNYSIEIRIEEERQDDKKTAKYSLNIEIVQFKSEKYAIQIDQVNTFVPKEQVPIKFQIVTIDVRGLVKIQFSEMIRIPANLTEIDQSVLEVSLISNNFDPDVEEKQKFSWKVKEFTASTMFIQLEFEYPSAISAKEQKDRLKVGVKDQNFFKSQSNSQKLIEEGFQDQKIVFQLLENDTATQLLVNSLKSGEQGVNGAIAANFMSNILLSGSLNLLWGLINCIQILAFFPLINLVMPANCQVLFAIIAKIATFDLVDITDQIQDLEVIFGIPQKETKPYHSNFKLMGFESMDPFKNLQLIFIAFVLFIFIPLIIRIFWLLMYCFKPVRNCIKKLESKLYWNSYIRFFLESYLELSIVSLIRIREFSFESKGESISTIFTVVVFTLAVLLIPGFAYILYRADPKQLKSSQYKAKYHELYDQLDVMRKAALFTPILFLLRRLSYALSVVLLIRFNFFQIQFLAFKMSLIMIYMGYVKPYTTLYKNKLEICNEIILLLAVYCLILFTEFVPGPEIRYKCGWAMIAVTFTLIAVNMTVVISTSIKDMVKKGKHKYQRYNFEKQVKMQHENELLNQRRLVYSQQQIADPLRRVKTDNFFTENSLIRKEDIATNQLREDLAGMPSAYFQSNLINKEINAMPTYVESNLIDTKIARAKRAKSTSKKAISSQSNQDVELKQRRLLRKDKLNMMYKKDNPFEKLNSIEEQSAKLEEGSVPQSREQFLQANDLLVQDVDEGSLQDEVIDLTEKLSQTKLDIDNSLQYLLQNRQEGGTYNSGKNMDTVFQLETVESNVLEQKRRPSQIKEYADIVYKHDLKLFSSDDHNSIFKKQATNRFDSQFDEFKPKARNSDTLNLNNQDRQKSNLMPSQSTASLQNQNNTIRQGNNQDEMNYFERLGSDFEFISTVQGTNQSTKKFLQQNVQQQACSSSQTSAKSFWNNFESYPQLTKTTNQLEYNNQGLYKDSYLEEVNFKVIKDTTEQDQDEQEYESQISLFSQFR